MKQYWQNENNICNEQLHGNNLFHEMKAYIEDYLRNESIRILSPNKVFDMKGDGDHQKTKINYIRPKKKINVLFRVTWPEKIG